MKNKSVGLSLLLTFLFGPLGLFYASAWGAVALIIIAAAGVVPTMGFVLIFVWPASMLWGAIAAGNKHKLFLLEGGPSVVEDLQVHPS